mmetsp:Transcript_6219/g.6815  ORF Transcript_6219/g.6815 Transcript_6219/m.6815 type:complete len:209 (+) Transcript_6219:98-724(+)
MQVPDYFRCPISHEIISDPVVAADGISYERKEIATWLTHHNTSPLTNIPLLNKTLIPNVNLRQAIEEYANQNGLTLQRPLPLLPPIDLEHRSRDLIRARLIEESLPLAPLNTLKHYHEGGVEFYFCRLTEEESSGKFGWGVKAIIANVERDRAFILTMGFHGFFFQHVQSKGIPLSDEYSVEGGGSRQDFEKGSSYWSPDTRCYFIPK